MQNLISHFLLKNTVCLRVSESEMYQLFLHSSIANGSVVPIVRQTRFFSVNKMGIYPVFI